ncbi:MAG TPA: phosphopantetheine-binding protein, partial [Thermoanaerobaculia bacterium]|nr:phosphopantetheine-binding protein [Thermoanaerobaculia bacterium]
AIGPPIANTTLYVLGRRLEPAPVGVPGELFIGGDGVALGYRGRAELTAERFLPDPFGDRCGRRGRPGARFYRTGDLVRWRPRGELEFLGRIDHQVKVRGFRIELGEVEAALEANPAVAQAVVVAQATPEAGGGRLVAYLVAPAAGPALAVAELRARLAQSLPEHMIPSAWVILDTLPLTPNGKVDRRALPPPDSAPAARAASYVAPRGALEEMIAGIWSEVLGVARVSVHDSFFEMGGHSLLGMQAVSRLGELLETEVPLRGLFEAPTVAGLAGKMVREAGPENDLETAARLVLELLHLTDDQVESLLAQEDGSALSLAPLAGTPPEGEAP